MINFTFIFDLIYYYLQIIFFFLFIHSLMENFDLFLHYEQLIFDFICEYYGSESFIVILMDFVRFLFGVVIF